jgi:mannose-6-phosphate isomerase-like protein (cupin superfamily)
VTLNELFPAKMQNLAPKKLLNGCVEVKSLLVTDQPATRPEAMARIITGSGELAVLSEGQIAIRHLAYLELRKGLIRGNHFHKVRHESFYLIAGEVEMHLKHMVTQEQISETLRTGDLVSIDPDVVHAFLPLREGSALEFAPEPFDEKDVYRHLIDFSKKS